MSANLLQITLLLVSPLAASDAKCDCTHFPWQPEPPCVETCGSALLGNGTVDEFTTVLKVDRAVAVKLLAESLIGLPVSFQKSLTRVSETHREQFWQAISSIPGPDLVQLFSSPSGECSWIVYPQSYGLPSSYCGAPMSPSVDDQISARVITEIENTTSTPLPSINISTEGGIVTISGTVESEGQLREISELVKSISGVKVSKTVDLKVDERQKDSPPSLRSNPRTSEPPHAIASSTDLSELSARCVKAGAWTAYFQSDEGKLAPVRDTWNTDNDEDWLDLRFTDFEGPRVRLGMFKVFNKSTETEESGKVPVRAIEATLTTALFQTKRFDIVEQKRAIPPIWKDVEPTQASIADVGRVLRVQYLVYGTINEWSPNVNRNLGPGSAGFWSHKEETDVALTLSLADATSGQVLLTTTERVRLDASNSGSQEAALGQALRALTNKAAFKIVTYLRDNKWTGTVVDVKGANIYINAGSQQGMAQQTRLSVQSVRGVIKDRESGTILGEDLREIGTLKVIAVHSNFSIARVVEGGARIKKGDRVALATKAVPPGIIRECAALGTSQNP